VNFTEFPRFLMPANSRSVLADAHCQRGEFETAKHWFDEAEKVERTRRPEKPQLSSMQGYAFCEYLLSVGRHDDVLDRASHMLRWAQMDDGLLAIGLAQLAAARAFALTQAASDTAMARLTEAISSLRDAGVEAYLFGVVVGLSAPGFDPFCRYSIQQCRNRRFFASRLIFDGGLGRQSNSPAVNLCLLHALQCSA